MLDIKSLSMSQPQGHQLDGLLRQGHSMQNGAASPELKDKFHDFVGQSFFGQMLSSMRETVGKPAYFHGGQAEEVFQGQLDQVLAEEMADASAAQFADPMFELFMLSRS